MSLSYTTTVVQRCNQFKLLLLPSYPIRYHRGSFLNKYIHHHKKEIIDGKMENSFIDIE